MIYKLSKKIVKYLEKENVLYEDREIYEYSIRLVISEMIATTFILLIGLFTHHFIEAILYEIILSTSRSILGGFHCKTYISCILLYVSLFIVNLAISNIKLGSLLIIPIEFIGLLMTTICNPISNENKPLSYNKRIKFKKLSIIYIIAIITIINIMIYYHIWIYNFIIYIFITLQILTIGGKINERKTKKQVLGDSFI